MSTFIRADIDFGLPYKVLTLRPKRNDPILAILRDTPTAAQLQREVEKHRPLLQGAIVAAIEYSISGLRWKLHVIHPSFPPLKQGEFPQEERLECCCKCGRPLPDTSIHVLLRGKYRNAEVECCSQECADARLKFHEGSYDR